ncbi:uncharacterized protein LOC143910291 [Arctopsyche grandis]|uniref:uncharacterized protein LOC143910291 n=1 Tax=Arctopsyche grandis TaxID=121162 RepID=UPI00406DA20C
MKHIKIDIKNNNKFIPRDFLVDTGAGISIIKESCLDEKTIYNKNDKIKVKGINQGSISESIGSVHLNLEFAHHKVYIMKDNEIDTTYDGIIGADFFEINQAKICYKINKLIINETIKIDLLNNNKDNEDDEILNNYIVKPRTETITKVEITNPEIIKSEIIDDELNQEGVYLVNANENNETLCTTLNTTDQQLRIDNLKVELKPISISTEINNFENESNIPISEMNDENFENKTNDPINEEDKDNFENKNNISIPEINNENFEIEIKSPELKLCNDEIEKSLECFPKIPEPQECNLFVYNEKIVNCDIKIKSIDMKLPEDDFLCNLLIKNKKVKIKVKGKINGINRNIKNGFVKMLKDIFIDKLIIKINNATNAEINTKRKIIERGNKPKFRITNKILWCKPTVKIKLKQNKYKLYKIYPLPIPHTDTDIYSLIIPTYKYIGVSVDDMSYTIFDNLENNCKNIINQIFICNKLNILSTLSEIHCETKLLKDVTKNIPEYCNTRNVKGKIDLWQKLTNNRWLYTLSESKKLTINCKNKKNEYVELFQTGIIKLDKGCKTNNGLISLNADNNIFTEYENPMSNINIINDKCCVIGKTNYSLHQLDPIKLINVDNTNTQKVLETFEKFNDKLENYQNQPAIVKHSSFFVKLIYGIIITIVILMLVKISFHLYKCFRDKKRFNVKYIRKTRDNVENEVEIVQIEPEIRSREEILNAISG